MAMQDTHWPLRKKSMEFFHFGASTISRFKRKSLLLLSDWTLNAMAKAMATSRANG